MILSVSEMSYKSGNHPGRAFKPDNENVECAKPVVQTEFDITGSGGLCG